MSDWIQTLEGRVLRPQALKVEQVGSINEIAHALALKIRFTGQTAIPYSVAEHCVRGASFLPPAFAGAFLLHELSEVYLPDIAAPLKPLVTVTRFRVVDADGTSLPERISWADLEREHTRVMLEALELSSLEPLIYSSEVRRMDLEMLAWEKRDICGPEPEPWGLPFGPPAAVNETWKLQPFGLAQAEEQFLQAFAKLFRGRS